MGMELLHRAAVGFKNILEMIPEANLEVTATDVIWSVEAIADKYSPEYRKTEVEREEGLQ